MTIKNSFNYCTHRKENQTGQQANLKEDRLSGQYKIQNNAIQSITKILY